MTSNNIIVREYLESLKEDSELDYLFPIMLNIMGFKIITTARESKGQSQYGKDIIAVGKDEKGAICRYFFELKGFDAKDITDYNFLKSDGVRDSILAAKLTDFNDKSIPGFNDLPIKIVFVHNGTISANTRPTFEGFIQKEFPNGGFERWDIYRLTELFSTYLFSEYLLTDEESLRLFKRTIVLLDAPEYDFLDFKKLVDIQIEKTASIKGRAFKKFFATMNLLSVIIHHYSKESKNLLPARECLTYLVLKVWRWILSEKLENKVAVVAEYRKLLNAHYLVLEEFFAKTIEIAQTTDGLFSEVGGAFEQVGYPMRSFDYLNYLIYYFKASEYRPDFVNILPSGDAGKLRNEQISILFKILENNDGCVRPILDNNSIAILNTFLFVIDNSKCNDDERDFIRENFLKRILENLFIIKKTKNRFPEVHNNLNKLIEFVTTGKRPSSYEDRSSLLLTILFELLVILNGNDIYLDFQKVIRGKVDLQTVNPLINDYNIEELLFGKHFNEEYFVESSIDLPDALEKFKTAILNKPIQKLEYRTDKAGFPFLRTLAHIYFENEPFPESWRSIISGDESA